MGNHDSKLLKNSPNDVFTINMKNELKYDIRRYCAFCGKNRFTNEEINILTNNNLISDLLIMYSEKIYKNKYLENKEKGIYNCAIYLIIFMLFLITITQQINIFIFILFISFMIVMCYKSKNINPIIGYSLTTNLNNTIIGLHFYSCNCENMDCITKAYQYTGGLNKSSLYGFNNTKINELSPFLSDFSKDINIYN